MPNDACLGPGPIYILALEGRDPSEGRTWDSSKVFAFHSVTQAVLEAGPLGWRGKSGSSSTTPATLQEGSSVIEKVGLPHLFLPSLLHNMERTETSL